MNDSKIHLKILLIMGLFLEFHTAHIKSSYAYDDTSKNLNKTSSPADETSSFESADWDTNFEEEDILSSTVIVATSTINLPGETGGTFALKTTAIKPSEIIVSASIPPTKEFQKSTPKSSTASRRRNDKMKSLDDAPTVKDDIPSLKSAEHEIKSTVKRVTPVLHYGVTPTESENNKNSSYGKFYMNSEEVTLSDFTHESIVETDTYSTKSLFEYYPEPIIAMSMDDLLYEQSKKKSQLNSNDQALKIGVSETTTSLYEVHLSDNLENQTEAKTKSLGFSEDVVEYTEEQLLMNATNPEDQNEENLNLSLSNRQDKSASLGNREDIINFLPNPVTTLLSTSNTSTEFPDLNMHNQSNYDITVSISENETSSNPDFKHTSESDVETTTADIANQQTLDNNLPAPTDIEIAVNENETVTSKDDKEYVVFVPRVCTNYSTINNLLNILNSAPNSKKIANLTCDKLRNIKIEVKSQVLFDKINKLLKTEAQTNDMIVIHVHPNATIDFEFLHQSNGLFIPMLGIIIFGVLMSFIITTVLGVWLHKSKCRRHSTSLNLNNLPHVNVKTDYRLAPIPRPSICYPDSSREFLHVYGQDNPNRTRQNGSSLNRRSYPDTVTESYEEVDRTISPRQELQTFPISSNGKKEFRAPNQDYESPNSWDRLHERNRPLKKYGVDNPGYSKW